MAGLALTASINGTPNLLKCPNLSRCRRRISFLPEGELKIARQFTAGFSVVVPQVPKGRLNPASIGCLFTIYDSCNPSVVPSGLDGFVPRPHP